jgi:hypothetical protein
MALDNDEQELVSKSMVAGIKDVRFSENLW